ncbi:MAG: hypothetical protein VX642_13670 [Bdellovibrionota bacterium]|nr:hypothetical protein [Bdellovibrionota bacterium]
MIFFKLGLLISSILFQQSLFAASSVISIHLRSFAPFESFGGGFEGDNRGFSTDPKVKSRIHTTLKYDYLQNRTLNITSYSSGTVYLPTGTTATAKPTASIDPNCSVDICISHSGGNPVTSDLGGGIGGYFTPDIDLHAKMNFVESGRYLSVSVEALGDAFPNAEVFLEDFRGNRVMLLKFQTEAGPNEGPIQYLPGDNKRPMGKVNCKIGLDSDGSFDGDLLCNEK